MTPEEIRTIAVSGGDNAVFYFNVVNRTLNLDYYLSVGTSNPEINPALSRLKNPVRKPVSERTPTMSDMRMLKLLRAEDLGGCEVTYLSRKPDLYDDDVCYHYRTTNEFLIDLESCKGDYGTLLTIEGNMKFILDKG